MTNIDKLYLKGEIIIAVIDLLESLDNKEPNSMKKFADRLNVILKIK